MRKSLLFIALLPLMAFACAGTHAARPPAAVTQPAEKNTILNKLEERMHEEEEAFKVLSDKMDEYQMLTAACESLRTPRKTEPSGPRAKKGSLRSGRR